MSPETTLDKGIISRGKYTFPNISWLTVKVSDPKGINPNKLFECIGKTALNNIIEDEPLKCNDLLFE